MPAAYLSSHIDSLIGTWYVLRPIEQCSIELLKAWMLWLFLSSSVLWCANILMATSWRWASHLPSTDGQITKYIQTLIKLLLASVELASIHLLASLAHELFLIDLPYSWGLWCLSMQSIARASCFASTSLSTLWVRFSRSDMAATWNTRVVVFTIFQ